MKRALLAAFSSALVLPGLGQVLNRQIIKGVLIMMAFTVLLIIAIMTSFFEVMDIMKDAELTVSASDTLIDVFFKGLATKSLTGLWIVLGLLTAVWLFGIVDAYIFGLRYKPAEEDK